MHLLVPTGTGDSLIFYLFHLSTQSCMHLLVPTATGETPHVVTTPIDTVNIISRSSSTMATKMAEPIKISGGVVTT